jgi:hypothetical protein
MLHIKKLHVVKETFSADSGLGRNHRHEALVHASPQHEMIHVTVKKRANMGLENISNSHNLTGTDPYLCILHRKGIKHGGKETRLKKSKADNTE